MQDCEIDATENKTVNGRIQASLRHSPLYQLFQFHSVVIIITIKSDITCRKHLVNRDVWSLHTSKIELPTYCVTFFKVTGIR